jgi:hypothetical protein
MSREGYALDFDELSRAQIDRIAAEYARGDRVRETAGRRDVPIWVHDLARENRGLPLRHHKRDGLPAEAARHLAAHRRHE